VAAQLEDIRARQERAQDEAQREANAKCEATYWKAKAAMDARCERNRELARREDINAANAEWVRQMNGGKQAEKLAEQVGRGMSGLPRMTLPPTNFKETATGAISQQLGNPSRVFGGIDPTGEALKHIQQVAPPISSSGVRLIGNMSQKIEALLAPQPDGSVGNPSASPARTGSSSATGGSDPLAATLSAKLQAWIPASKPTADSPHLSATASPPAAEPVRTTQPTRATWGNFDLFDPKGPTKQQPLNGLFREVRP